MYILINKINKIVSRVDLSKVFTFSEPIYKAIEPCADTQIYFYRKLSDIFSAEALNKEKLLGELSIEFVQVVLEECCISSPLKASHCICILSRTCIPIEDLENLFGASVCCYLEADRSEKMFYLVEFNKEVEIKDQNDGIQTFTFEDYIDHLVKFTLYS